MDFSKYEAAGNDFLIVDGREGSFELTEGLVRALCERRTGVGADGVIAMLPSITADLRMRIFNANGSEAEMCGNGIRALCLHALEKGAATGDSVTFETAAGKRLVSVVEAGRGAGRFKVDMGPPQLERGDIPMKGPSDSYAVGEEIEVESGVLKATCLSMGNPHCVFFVENLHDYPVSLTGGQVEKSRMFPKRTNVEFVEVLSPRSLAMRVWERGVGETAGCGTGACAAVVAASLNGLAERSARVSMAGGELEVEWTERTVTLAGPARRVFEGRIDPEG